MHVMHLQHPYRGLNGGRWVKGNLHAHTTFSDGARSRQAVIDDYADRGHGFLMISDHDIYTGPEDYATLHSRGLALIPGNEVSAAGPHMLHVNASARLAPDNSRQQVIDQALKTGGWTVLNHPNWQERFDHFPLAHMAALTGYVGIEIYNGVIGRLDGSSYALDKWDMLLSFGRRVWGFANDDSHAATDCGLGWNCVYTPEQTVPSIVAALHAGRFYASTGVDIRSIDVEGDSIRVRTDNAERIVAVQQHGRRLKTVDEPEIVLQVPDTARYVRFECWGRGERFAWTQPFWVQP